MSEVASAYVSIIPSYRGGTRKIAEQLVPSAGKAGDQAGREAGDRGGKSFASRFAASAGKGVKGLGTVVTKSLVGTLAVGAGSVAAAGLAGMAANGVALAGALTQASGAAVLIPGALAGGVAVAGTLAIAFQGMGDAFKALASGDAKKLDDAMRNLAPNAQRFVTSIKSAVPALQGIRGFVQDNLFYGLGPIFAKALTDLGPIARSGFGSIAASLNVGLRSTFAAIDNPANLAGVSTIFTNVGKAIREAAVGAAPLVNAIIRFTSVSSTFLPGIGHAFGQIATQAGAFIDRIASDGTLQRWAQNGLNVLSQLGGVVRNVGSILASVFSAGAGIGTGLLANLQKVTLALANFLKSTQGTEALQGIFSALSASSGLFLQALAPLAPVIGTVGRTIGQIAQSFGPVLVEILTTLAPAIQTVVTAFGPLVSALGPALVAIAGALASAVQVLAPALLPVAQAIGSIAIAVAPLLPVLARLIAGVLPPLATAVASLVQAFAPLVVILVTALTPILSAVAGVFARLATAIAPVFTQLATQLAPVLPPLSTAVVGLLNAFLPLVPVLVAVLRAVVPIIAPVLRLATFLINLAAGAIRPLIAIAAALLTPLAKMPSVFDVVRAAVGKITDAFNGAKTAVGAVFDVIKGIPGKIAGLGSKFLDAGKGVIKSLLSGLGAGVGKLLDLGAKIKEVVNSALGLPRQIGGYSLKVHGVGVTLPTVTIPAFAMGGVSPGGPIIVGERGPEMINSNACDRISTANQTRRALGGGATITNNITQVDDPVGTAAAVSRRLAAQFG